jgi:hypothetical protein
MVIYHGILTLEKVGTAVNHHGIFINTGQKYHGILTLKMRYHSKLLWYFYNIGPRG